LARLNTPNYDHIRLFCIKVFYFNELIMGLGSFKASRRLRKGDRKRKHLLILNDFYNMGRSWAFCNYL